MVNELSIGDIGAIAGLLLTAVTVAFAGYELRRTRRTTRAQFLFQVTTWYLENSALRQFFYKLDYHQWRFDPQTFSGSAEEPLIDHFLHLFETVEQLIRSGALKQSEVGILAFEASRVLHNSEVEKYLVWLDGEYKKAGRPTPAFGRARALARRLG